MLVDEPKLHKSNKINKTNENTTTENLERLEYGREYFIHLENLLQIHFAAIFPMSPSAGYWVKMAMDFHPFHWSDYTVMFAIIVISLGIGLYHAFTGTLTFFLKKIWKT